MSVPDRDCDALRDRLLAEQARVVIEIGLAYGSSALAIAEALVTPGTDGARHFIIDAYQEHFHDAGWNTIIAAGVADVCSLLRERSQLALPRLMTDGLVADAAFVDGSHTFHNVFVDLFFLSEIVRPGGLVVLDDHYWPSVATAARYFEHNTGWQAVSPGQETRLQRLPRAESQGRTELRGLPTIRARLDDVTNLSPNAGGKARCDALPLYESFPHFRKPGYRLNPFHRDERGLTSWSPQRRQSRCERDETVAGEILEARGSAGRDEQESGEWPVDLRAGSVRPFGVGGDEA